MPSVNVTGTACSFYTSLKPIFLTCIRAIRSRPLLRQGPQGNHDQTQKEESGEGVDWYEKAKEFDHIEVTGHLAECWFELGKRCSRYREFEQALSWYEKAAEAGHSQAAEYVSELQSKLE